MTQPELWPPAIILLANDGPVVNGTSLESAVFAAEEIEEAAKLKWILPDRQMTRLSDTQIESLVAG
jgi:ribulose-5-phosphate 4-epimerase/fuculose-1-phosphate aldolase